MPSAYYICVHVLRGDVCYASNDSQEKVPFHELIARFHFNSGDKLSFTFDLGVGIQGRSQEF